MHCKVLPGRALCAVYPTMDLQISQVLILALVLLLVTGKVIRQVLMLVLILYYVLLLVKDRAGTDVGAGTSTRRVLMPNQRLEPGIVLASTSSKRRLSFKGSKRFKL